MIQTLKLLYIAIITVIVMGQMERPFCSEANRNGQHNLDICKPELSGSQVIEMGHSGMFGWSCDAAHGKGAGYYIVFIRPTGTYVLLKVPIGKNSFEFTPDTTGLWRWMVINTDPDRTKPDVESEPGLFQVINTEQ